jgi:hypothetical protein
LLYERVAGGNDDMKNNARILARQPIDGVENKAFGKACGRCNPQFTGRRVGQKLDFLDPLIKFIERRNAALEERLAILRGLDAVCAALEQRYTESMLCIGKRP